MTRRDPQATEPDREPRDSQVLAEPATVERCAQDYTNGTPTRTAVFDNWSQQRR
jgi:hypothetical protein